MPQQNPSASPSTPLRLRSLGKPCRSRNILAGRLVDIRGRREFILTNMNEASRMELVRIDIERRTAKVVVAPAGSGAWALNHLGDGVMAVGTYYDGTWMLYDCNRNRWTATAKFPGEDYLWNFAIGTDGKIYTGTYPGGKLGSYDPATGKVDDCGAPTKDSGNQYLRYVSPLPDGRIFCNFGMSKQEFRIWDPARRRWDSVPETLSGITWGSVWNQFLVAGKGAWKGSGLERVDPLPFPTPPVDDWNVDVPLTDANRLVLRSGRRVWIFKTGQTQLTECAEVPFPTGNVYAVDDDGTLYGARGQDWFVAQKGKKPFLDSIPGEMAPRPTHLLRADDNGRVWGGPTFGQTLFHVDVRTRKITNTRTVSDFGGEVYDLVVVDGICYAAAYVGGEVIRYDPDAPWNQIDHVNPRSLLALTPDYIRPTGGICALPGKRLASGWQAKYGSFGGAVAVTDLATEKSQVFRDPLGPWNIQGICAAGDLIFFTTGNSANGLPSRTDVWSQWGLMDPNSGRIVDRGEIVGERAATWPVYDPATDAVFLIAEGRIRRLDVKRRILDAPSDSPKASGAGLVLHQGKVLHNDGNQLLAYDPATRKSEAIAELPAKPTRIAASTYGIFAMVGVELFKVG